MLGFRSRPTALVYFMYVSPGAVTRYNRLYVSNSCDLKSRTKCVRVCIAISQSRVLSPATRRPQSVIPFCVYKKLIIIAVSYRVNGVRLTYSESELAWRPLSGV